MNRRTFLRTGFAGSVAGLAGCLGSDVDDGNGGSSGSNNVQQQDNDADNDGVRDSEDDYPNNSNWSAKDEKSGHLSIKEDEWYQWELTPSQTMGIEYDIIVRNGPSVDVILFSEEEFNHYENGDRARYHEGGSSLDTKSARVETVLDSGNYVLVIDNTNWGEAAPPTDFDDNHAEVEYSLTLKM